MKTFIRITEVWVPSKDRTHLEFHSGLYGDHRQFRSGSERMAFGYDEGLPGKAWAARHPMVLKDLEQSYFRRAELARQAGITCGVAMPIFAGEHLMAVLVMFCGDDEEHVGAIEVWHHAADGPPEMALVDGYYGMAESFEFSSRRTTFRRGFGLPGLVWDSGAPLVIADLTTSSSFLRRDDARRVGICSGLGLPCSFAPGHDHVMTFLSALGTPIARRFEIWLPESGGRQLVFSSGVCIHDRQLDATYDGARIERGLGILGRALFTGVPALSEAIAEERTVCGESAARAGFTSAIAIPILAGGRSTAVVAMYF